MTFGNSRRSEVSAQITAATADLSRVADSASGVLAVVGIVALAALVLATVAIARTA